VAWTKSPQSLIDLFEKSVPSGTSVSRRKMFGYPAAFANGNSREVNRIVNGPAQRLFNRLNPFTTFTWQVQCSVSCVSAHRPPITTCNQ